ncbi:hypothetical protein CYMTET_2801 [Cymbomonas tetramitiformis]|uniref:Uncharacterized protein n=1 Tax=Cymbomonas tetramitiformis TaxID=36881 RepID=A0AAE0H4M2_9CHLO|nr:hypothetical protein CYMTET_2801 [Cymbomonas tetramitiformis]
MPPQSGTCWSVLNESKYADVRRFCAEQRDAHASSNGIPCRTVPAKVWGGNHLRTVDLTILDPDPDVPEVTKEQAAKSWTKMFTFLRQAHPLARRPKPTDADPSPDWILLIPPEFKHWTIISMHLLEGCRKRDQLAYFFRSHHIGNISTAEILPIIRNCVTCALNHPAPAPKLVQAIDLGERREMSLDYPYVFGML